MCNTIFNIEYVFSSAGDDWGFVGISPKAFVISMQSHLMSLEWVELSPVSTIGYQCQMKRSVSPGIDSEVFTTWLQVYQLSNVTNSKNATSNQIGLCSDEVKDGVVGSKCYEYLPRQCF